MYTFYDRLKKWNTPLLLLVFLFSGQGIDSSNATAEEEATAGYGKSGIRQLGVLDISPGKSKQNVETLSGRINLAPNFDYKLKDRYGLDSNGNGVIDIPNTSEYVLGLSPGECTSRGKTFCDTYTPVYDVTFDAGVTQAWTGNRGTTSRIKIDSYSWKISGGPPSSSGFALPSTTKQDPMWQVMLPAGTYTVELTVSGAGTSSSVTKSVIVRDILIVAAGDSFSSGEGNPDHHAIGGKYAYWADDGHPSSVIHSNRATQQGKDHIRAHRSTLAYASQTALEIERADPHTSVTFIDVAASGATITRGLLGSYPGVNGERHTRIKSPLLPQLDEIRNLTKRRTIDAIVLTIGGNDIGFANVIAALLARNGAGTDVGFPKIVESVQDGNWERVRQKIGSGPAAVTIATLVGGLFGGQLGSAYLLGSVISGDLGDRLLEKRVMQDAAGLQLLPDLYAKLNIGLCHLLTGKDSDALPSELTAGLTPVPCSGHEANRIFILKYQDMSKELELSSGLFHYCKNSANMGPFEIGEAEWRRASDDVFEPLNAAIGRAANTHGWTLVTSHVQDSRSHGYCGARPYDPENYEGHKALKQDMRWPTPSDTRWVRSWNDSKIIQDDDNFGAQNGAFHPNEFGHRAMKERLLEKLLPHLGLDGHGPTPIPQWCNPCYHDDPRVQRAMMPTPLGLYVGFEGLGIWRTLPPEAYSTSAGSGITPNGRNHILCISEKDCGNMRSLQVYAGKGSLDAMIPYKQGMITAFFSPQNKDAWGIYYSPDGLNLGGGGQTLKVYSGKGRVDAMIPYKDGVITAFYNPANSEPWGIYYSPDGLNLGGGGRTLKVYSGKGRVDTMIPYKNGVVTAFYHPKSKGAWEIHYSPDGFYLGSGGKNTLLYAGKGRIDVMMPYKEGIITAFYNPDTKAAWGIYYSPDGLNLGGGGSTILAYQGEARVNAMIPYREGVITSFYSNRDWWGNGMYYSPDGLNLGGGNGTSRQTPDGVNEGLVDSVVPFAGGVVTALYHPQNKKSQGIFFSPDGDWLVGGGATRPTLCGIFCP